MRIRIAATALALAAGLAFTAAPDALAKGAKDRLNEKVELPRVQSTLFSSRDARVRVTRRSLKRQSMRIDLRRAAGGFDVEVWMQDGDGAMARVGAMRERGRGTYVFTSRARRGQALPFGIADVGALSDRSVELRIAGGAAVATGRLPVMETATPNADSKMNVKSAMLLARDDEGVGHERPGDAAMDVDEAYLRVRRGSENREELKIEVEGPRGLRLDAWIDDGTGAFERIDDLIEWFEKEGSEYELVLRNDLGTLPLGATSIGELAGQLVEVRLENGDVVARGFVPDIGVPGADRDGHDGDVDHDADHHDADHHDADHHDAGHHDAGHHDAGHHDADHHGDDADHEGDHRDGDGAGSGDRGGDGGRDGGDGGAGSGDGGGEGGDDEREGDGRDR